MSTRNLEFLTPSRWLPTTRGSRHLIAPTATGPSLSLSFSLPPLPSPSSVEDDLLFPLPLSRLLPLPPHLKYLAHTTVGTTVVLQAAVRSDRIGAHRCTTASSAPSRARGGGGKKKRRRRRGFRDRTTFAPSRRVRTAAARGGRGPPIHVDIRPDTYTPSHYFQFMFLLILKSANFRGPPAGRSSAAKIYMSCV